MLTKFEIFKSLKINEIVEQEKSKTNLAASNKVRRCITQIMGYYGFFADLFMQLKIMEAHPRAKIKTMATDGQCIAYNPFFVHQLTEEQICFVLIHEVMHNANFHFLRMGDRHPKLWNRAADYAINLQIEEMKSEEGGSIFDTPPRILLDKKFKVDGSIMSAEQIYNILEKEKPKKPNNTKRPPKPPPQPIEIYPGMKVRLKNGKKGVVKEIIDGKYIIDEIKEEYQKVVENIIYLKFNKFFEMAGQGPVCNLPTVGDPQIFNREDFIPIQKAGGGCKGGACQSKRTNDEFETEGDNDDDDSDGGNDDSDDSDDSDDDDDDEYDDSVPGAGDIRKPGSLDGDGEAVEGYEGSDELGGKKTAEEIAKEWTDILTNAKSKNAGTGSPSLDRSFFNKIGKPKVNWKNVLRKFMNQCFASDPNYQYFNKRFISGGLYIPGIKYPKSEGFRNIVLIIDTSGSITKETLTKFANEFYGILSSKKVKKTTMIWCDDVVQKVEELDTTSRSGERLSKEDFEEKFLRKIKPKGNGGTSFIPPFVWIEKNMLKNGVVPSFVVYFTDAGGEAPNPQRYGIPKYKDKILWVITEASSAPHIQFPQKLFIDKIID